MCVWLCICRYSIINCALMTNLLPFPLCLSLSLALSLSFPSLSPSLCLSPAPSLSFPFLPPPPPPQQTKNSIRGETTPQSLPVSLTVRTTFSMWMTRAATTAVPRGPSTCWWSRKMPWSVSVCLAWKRSTEWRLSRATLKSSTSSLPTTWELLVGVRVYTYWSSIGIGKKKKKECHLHKWDTPHLSCAVTCI